MNMVLTFQNVVNQLWPVVEPADRLPALPDEVEIEWVDMLVGDKVIVYGNYANYTGFVKALDKAANEVKVTVWDSEIRAPFTAWWPLERVYAFEDVA